MSDPVFVNNSVYVYFICDRPPTASEPAVTAIGIPSDWLFYWWDTATGDIYDCVSNVEDNIQWQKRLTNRNNPMSNWEINTNRPYDSPNVTFGESRTPNINLDTQVIITLNQVSTMLTAATVDVAVNTGSGDEVIATSSVSGLTADLTNVVTVPVPAGAAYTIFNTVGTNNIINVKELTS